MVVRDGDPGRRVRSSTTAPRERRPAPLTALVIGFVVLFVLSGLGNGSVYKMIPAIFEAQVRAIAGAVERTGTGRASMSGALIGIAGAVGGLGGVGINLVLRASYSSPAKSATMPPSGSSSVFYVRLRATSTTGSRSRAARRFRRRLPDRRLCCRVTAIPRAAATATHCPYCGLQCAMTLTGTPCARRSTGPASFPTNRGGLCQKGWTAPNCCAPRTGSPLRWCATTASCRRRRGTTRWTSWPTSVRRSRREHGADAVGIFGGGGLTNEKAYMLGKFARVALRTRRTSTTTAGSACRSAAAAGIQCFGLDRGLPFPLADIGSAKAVLLLGGNVAETMPPLVAHLRTAADAGGLIVADPRRTATVERALTGRGRAPAARARHGSRRWPWACSTSR